MKEEIIVNWLLRVINITTLVFAFYGFIVFVNKIINLIRERKKTISPWIPPITSSGTPTIFNKITLKRKK